MHLFRDLMSTSSQLGRNETMSYDGFSGYVDVNIIESLHQQFLNAVDILELDISGIDSLEFEKIGTELCVKFDSHSNQNNSHNGNEEQCISYIDDEYQEVLLVEEILMNDELCDSFPENILDQDLDCLSLTPMKQPLKSVKTVKRGCKRKLDTKNVHDTEGFKITKNSKAASARSHHLAHTQPKRRSQRIRNLKQLHESINSDPVDEMPFISGDTTIIDQTDLLGQKLTRMDEAKDYIQPIKISQCHLDKEKHNTRITKSKNVTTAKNSDESSANSVAINKSSNSLKLKLFKCFKCDSTFKRKSHYVTHLIKVHLNLLECSQCGHAFSHKQYLDKHVVEFHV